MRATVNTRQNFWHFSDIFLTSWDVWCLASNQSQRRKSCNKAELNDKLIQALPKRAFSVNSVAAYQVKVKYGEERFWTFLIKDITFAKLVQEIKRNCSPLAHLPASNIRVRYRDEDGDMINLWDDSSGFSFGEKLRSAKEVKELDYKKIFLQASKIDSPLTSKMRRTDLGRVRKLTTSRCNRSTHSSFTPEAARPPTTTGNHAEKSPLDFRRQEIEENVQILKVQVASAKEELEKLNCESRHFQSLSEIRGRLCNNCHCCGHTKVKCSKAPCKDINACKIKKRHPEHKAKISQLQREIRYLENKVQEEEAHLKGFTTARERAKSSFFYVMRPRLKKQNQVIYSKRSRLDWDLIILQRAIKKVPDWSEDEDWRLPLIIEQYENSNVNIYLNEWTTIPSILWHFSFLVLRLIFHIPFSFLYN